ncbi:putative Tic20 family protein [Cryobacterium psychrotolerans]|nr:putative Tic20 family protein [Cryobacterium psychrotolerans]
MFIWFFVMEHGGFVAEDAKSALNFRITVMAGYLMFNGMSIAAAAAFGSSSVFSLLGTIVWALGAALSVIGFGHAWNGHHYHYPFTLDLVR